MRPYALRPTNFALRTTPYELRPTPYCSMNLSLTGAPVQGTSSTQRLHQSHYILLIVVGVEPLAGRYANPSTYLRSLARRGTLLCASFMPRAFIQAAKPPRATGTITSGRNTLPVIRSR